MSRAVAEPAPAQIRPCRILDLGRMGFREAFDLQVELVRGRKAGEVCDQLLFVEHPPTITLGRNADGSNVLAPAAVLRERGFDVVETDRGGDVTYHGPGQLVAYPIFDLREWRRDVGAYMRALEEVVMLTLADFGVRSRRVEGWTGVWVGDAKIAAMGVHLSRWVASHGLALNVNTDLEHFGTIVPCGLPKPVTSMERVLGRPVGVRDVMESMGIRFGEVFGRSMAGGAPDGWRAIALPESGRGPTWAKS